jgi:hypothetical protein
MDELPELLVETVGGATVIETIDIGGDALAITSTATHLYRSEGLLSEESIETFTHDVERFTVDRGRRKSSLHFVNLDDEESFTVPTKVVDPVIEAVLEGILRTTGVIDTEETVRAQFRFSELSLVVTDAQLLKHVGGAVWDDEYETFRYENLTGLDFEEGSVATQVIVEAEGRRQRVKVPNDYAGRVREEVQSAIFEYHDVSSLGGLHAAVGIDEEEEESDTTSALDEAQSTAEAADESADDTSDETFVDADWSPPADQDPTGPRGDRDVAEPSVDANADRDVASAATPSTEAGEHDVEALAARVDELTERVEYQTELLEAQQETIEQLVEELRRGR